MLFYGSFVIYFLLLFFKTHGKGFRIAGLTVIFALIWFVLNKLRKIGFEKSERRPPEFPAEKRAERASELRPEQAAAAESESEPEREKAAAPAKDKPSGGLKAKLASLWSKFRSRRGKAAKSESSEAKASGEEAKTQSPAEALIDELLSLTGRLPEGLKIKLKKLINKVLLIKKRQADAAPGVASDSLAQAERYLKVLSALMHKYVQALELNKTNPDQSVILALTSKVNDRVDRIDRALSHEYQDLVSRHNDDLDADLNALDSYLKMRGR